MSAVRCRVLFAKTEAMRFTGHLDLQRAWERMCRRAGLPVAYSAGFHPHPKIQIGAALPLGVTGEHELLDLGLEEERPAEDVARALAGAAPPGLSALGAEILPPQTPGLERLILAGDYFAEPVEASWPADLAERISKLMASPALVRERRGKEYDLRPRIFSLALEGSALAMRLSLAQDATGRPDEVLAALGLEDIPSLARRARLLLKTEDGLRGSDSH